MKRDKKPIEAYINYTPDNNIDLTPLESLLISDDHTLRIFFVRNCNICNTPFI